MKWFPVWEGAENAIRGALLFATLMQCAELCVFLCSLCCSALVQIEQHSQQNA